jgi:ketosteroid isomerase-like protein
MTMSPRGPTPPDAAAADLVALEERFERALAEADVDALDEIVSDDWIVIGPDGGLTTKTAFLAVVKSGALTHSTMVSDETRVRVHGDTAIVTARVVATGVYQGQPFTTRERSTDVFVREQGPWRCVLTQLTTIPTKG